jgi:hypothetical protein
MNQDLEKKKKKKKIQLNKTNQAFDWVSSPITASISLALMGFFFGLAGNEPLPKYDNVCSCSHEI